MFIGNVSGQEATNTLATSIGCKAGEAMRGMGGYGRPGVIGNTFPIKDELKARGAKFDGENKAWCFESWEALHDALDAIVNP